MTARLLTQAIGEGVFDDQTLAALPAWLARAVGARSAMILWRHLDGVHEVLAFNRNTPAHVALYAWKYAALDPWLKAARASPRRAELLCLDHDVPAASFERSRLYREFIRPRGDDTFHAAVAVFDAPCGEALLCLHRGRGEAPFTQADIDPLSEDLPELARLLSACGEVVARRRREQVARDDLDGLGMGAVVVRGDGRIARMNLAADQVLRRSDGFRSRSGVLSCADPASRLRLQAALALATAPDSPMATAIPVERTPIGPTGGDSGPRPLAYIVSVTPMPGDRERPLAMLVFRDPDNFEASLAGRLRGLFRPTRREASVPMSA